MTASPAGVSPKVAIAIRWDASSALQSTNSLSKRACKPTMKLFIQQEHEARHVLDDQSCDPLAPAQSSLTSPTRIISFLRPALWRQCGCKRHRPPLLDRRLV